MEYFSQKLQEAINLAIKAHCLDQKQLRKGTQIPYIIHPLIVGMLLAKVTKDEDVIEDSSNKRKVTVKAITNKFGSKIGKLVAELSEDDKDKVSWKERKNKTIESISNMSKYALLIKSANMLHNLNDMILTYKNEGKNMFIHFNADKEAQLEKNKKYVAAIKKAWNENPFVPELCARMSEMELVFATV